MHSCIPQRVSHADRSLAAEQCWAAHKEGLVVDVADFRAVNALALVLLQLVLENVLVEETLQLLVGRVDAQLLETTPKKQQITKKTIR